MKLRMREDSLNRGSVSNKTKGAGEDESRLKRVKQAIVSSAARRVRFLSMYRNGGLGVLQGVVGGRNKQFDERDERESKICTCHGAWVVPLFSLSSCGYSG